MNLIKKIYCRIYQFAFHAALPVLPYREPQCFHSINQIEPLLKELGFRSILLVTDKQIRGAGITASLEESLEKSGISGRGKSVVSCPGAYG